MPLGMAALEDDMTTTIKTHNPRTPQVIWGELVSLGFSQRARREQLEGGYLPPFGTCAAIEEWHESRAVLLAEFRAAAALGWELEAELRGARTRLDAGVSA